MRDVEIISINLKEAAKATGIAPRTLQQMAKAGTAPARRIGRRFLFPVIELREWITSSPAGSDKGN